MSGPASREIAERILRFAAGPCWVPRRAAPAELIGSGDGPVDQVIATFFQAPHSYTAQDTVEISCHGSPVVLRYCVESACRAGARPAGPGEFTLRAFVNGRIDLPQAEAVRDLIAATTLYQAKVAIRQIEGSGSRSVAPLKEQLVDLVSLMEAGIDFADDDVPVAPASEITGRIGQLIEPLRRLAASFDYGRLVHSGMSLAIVGRPNVGKSSLFNRLVEQERAIVTDIPGTTRDLVSEVTSLEGIPVKCIDTAGIRENGDRIEALGIQRSLQAMADADLTLLVVDLSEPAHPADETLLEKVSGQGRYVLIGNKCDLPRRRETSPAMVAVSALTGEGVGRLRERILQEITPEGGVGLEAGFITNIRQAQLLDEAAARLERARQAAAGGIPHEMILLDLYAALQGLDSITGATTAEDILGRIFSTFCVGK